MDYLKLLHDLLNLIPEDQKNHVCSYDKCEIDHEYIGFIDKYYYLSQIIPKEYVVIDFGCGYNAQSFYFQQHKRYISVDVDPCFKFKSPNCDIYQMSIQKFISNRRNQINFEDKEVFALCSYVPDDNAQELVKNTFRDCFVFYPTIASSTIRITLK